MTTRVHYSLEFFHLLIEPRFYTKLVEETNRYADQRQAETGVTDVPWKPTTEAEIRSFIAINILLGINQLPDIDCYWSTDDRLGVQVISKIIPKRT